ncbi:MAG: ABC transporter ATP-binding protein [Dongiaceae bacterium]
MTLLSVSNASSGYGTVKILKGVSVEVGANEIVAIVGANGSGKSTLLKMISGVLPAYEGSIQFKGRAIHGLKPHEIAGIGLSYVPQVQSTFPSLTVEENLRIAAETFRSGRSKLDDIFRIFPQLAEFRRRKAGLLSGGGRQMLGISMGLMSDPALLLLDEPTAALSPVVAQIIMDKIVQQIVPMNVSVLIVEQRVQEVLKIADRAYVMVDGKVAKEAAAASLTEAHLVQLFLGGAA